MSSNPRLATQRGSALLIVFVFAAMLAIMLYREMPVVAFEAQRQKEELLMDRGNEYKRAVKLYVRKFQTFPPSIQALESTNRMRFLRNKYVDPFTGKSDWRLLHAGPGGIITDSQIKQKTPSLNGGGTAASGSTAASNPFGSSGGFGATSAGADLTAAAGNTAVPQRPPAIALNGGAASNGDLPFPADTSQADSQQPTPSVPSPGLPYPGYPGPPTAPIPGQTNSGADLSQAGAGAADPMATSSGPFPTSNLGRLRPGGPTGNSSPAGQFAGDPNMQAAAQAPNAPDQQNMMQSLLNNQNPQPTVQTGSPTTSAFNSGSNAPAASSNNSLAVGGGIAGVASMSHGHTIKIVNDQSDRHLWEFVYDMQKEATANAPGMGGQNGTASANGTGSALGGPANTSGFGSTSQNANQTNNLGANPGGSSPSPTAPVSPNQ